MDEATTIGTAVHLAIENYLYGKEWEHFTDDKIGLLSQQIAKRFIDDCLNDIDEVWGLESGLVVDGLYAGTADCIGMFEVSQQLLISRRQKRSNEKIGSKTIFYKDQIMQMQIILCIELKLNLLLF